VARQWRVGVASLSRAWRVTGALQAQSRRVSGALAEKPVFSVGFVNRSGAQSAEASTLA
jgi:hypothetical protein